MSLSLVAAFAIELIFAASVDDRHLGEYRYDITEREDGIHVKSLADFRATVLRVPVFTYRHEVEELWRDRCLVELRSVTRSNRQDWSVSGRIENGVFVVERTHDNETTRATLEPCVATYVYWDPRLLLTQKKLLNAQTGVYEPVSIETTTGTESAPEHVRLTGPAFVIDLDYRPSATDPQWVGLDTSTRDGRHVVYRRIEVKERP